MEANAETVEYLKLGELVNKMPKKTGGKPFLVPRLFIEKIRNKWRMLKESLEAKVGEEKINEVVEKKQERIQEKIDNWVDYSEEVQDQAVEQAGDTRSWNNAAAALTYSKSQIEKLQRKQVKVGEKGLGVFALSAMAVKKVASDKFHEVKEIIEYKVQKFKENRQAKKAEREEERTVKKAKKETAKAAKKSEVTELLKQIYEQLKIQNELKRREMEYIYGYNPEQAAAQTR